MIEVKSLLLLIHPTEEMVPGLHPSKSKLKGFALDKRQVPIHYLKQLSTPAQNEKAARLLYADKGGSHSTDISQGHRTIPQPSIKIMCYGLILRRRQISISRRIT
jgi:hypothetical protein